MYITRESQIERAGIPVSYRSRAVEYAIDALARDIKAVLKDASGSCNSGEVCDSSSSCGSGEVCDSSGSCSSGEVCDSSGSCGSGEICDSSGSCNSGKVCGAASIRLAEKALPAECYELEAEALANCLVIRAGDELGFIYGIYGASRRILGVQDFWFWNDQRFEIRERIDLPDDYFFASHPFAVKYRGWFINDEVLISAWSVDQDPDKPWVMAFESLLRCGGNMVIPGTDRNGRRYRRLASDMGLTITHHHAEPLGAEMFARVYPDLNPSYGEHSELFHKLWAEGIWEQKGTRVIWNLGFRGQGDLPFWAADPQYSTDEARGELIGSLIWKQYRMAEEACPGAVCCTNLYGEIMELYQKGCLKLPENVIKIWADNGYGKMVSRRQDNHNPRIPALPEEPEDAEGIDEAKGTNETKETGEVKSTDKAKETEIARETGIAKEVTDIEDAEKTVMEPSAESRGHHGIYYHVSFYDLQAANHITMLPNSPQFVRDELRQVLARGVNDYWIINCSNIKPHNYYLGMIASMWQKGDVEPEEYLDWYVSTYCFGKSDNESAAAAATGKNCNWSVRETAIREEIKDCYREYHRAAVAYGSHEDEHAGEQFCNHVTRILATQWMKDSHKTAEELAWACPGSLPEQMAWYRERCHEGEVSYANLVRNCEKVTEQLEKETAAVKQPESETAPAEQPDGEERNRLLHGATFLRDHLLLHARIYMLCYAGAVYFCDGFFAAEAGDAQKAFFLVGRAAECYADANEEMRAREHDRWAGFYSNECLTDVKQTAWVLKGLMAWIRTLDDGPHFYRWQRDFLYKEEDRRVTLILNMENHMTDEEMYQLMKQRERV